MYVVLLCSTYFLFGDSFLVSSWFGLFVNIRFSFSHLLAGHARTTICLLDGLPQWA